MKKNSKIKKLKTTVSKTINRKKKRGPFLRVQKVYFYLQFFFQDQEIDTFKIVKIIEIKKRNRMDLFWRIRFELLLRARKIGGPWLPSQKKAKRGRGKPTLRSKTERNVTKKKTEE